MTSNFVIIILVSSVIVLSGTTAVYKGPCTKPGLVGDPDDPRQYYNSQSSGSSTSSIATASIVNGSHPSFASSFEYSVLQCPEGSSWDPKSSSCSSANNTPGYQCKLLLIYSLASYRRSIKCPYFSPGLKEGCY